MELQSHIKEGGQVFLNQDNQLIFKDTMNEILDASGARRASVFTATHNGRSYFIKQLKADRTVDSILQEIQNAKLLALLGLSPNTHLVRSNNIPFLVMEQVPGINIKEVLVPVTRNEGTKARIDKVLGVETESVDEAARTFARIMSANPEYEARLREIAEALDAFNYTDTSDFQFMVDLSVGPSSIKIIDSEDFKRNTPLTNDTPTAELSVLHLIDLIRQLSH